MQLLVFYETKSRLLRNKNFKHFCVGTVLCVVLDSVCERNLYRLGNNSGLDR